MIDSTAKPERPSKKGQGLQPITHGSIYGYKMRDCRCEPCVMEYRRIQRHYQAGRKARDAAKLAAETAQPLAAL